MQFRAPHTGLIADAIASGLPRALGLLLPLRLTRP